MDPRQGYYSLIQYCPDASRLEAVNVGVLMFCPEPHFLRAKTITSNDRVRRLFGPDYGVDLQHVNVLKRGIEHNIEVEGAHIRTLDDLEAYIAGLANEVRISPPRPMAIAGPHGAELDELVEELVLGHRAAASATRGGPKSGKAVRQAFEQPELAPYIRRDVTVRVPALHDDWRIPYAYENGRLNLVRPVDFGKTSPVARACEHAVAGRSIYEHPDENLGLMQLVLVADFAPELGGERQTILELLDEYRVNVHPAADLDPLVAEVLRSSRLLPV